PALQLNLQVVEFVSRLVQMLGQALDLSLQQVRIEGHHDGAGLAEHGFLSAVDFHVLQTGRGQAAEAAARDFQQFGMLGGHQGSHKVKGGILPRLEAFQTVVPLVEDHSDVLAGLGQLPVLRGEFRGDGLELGAVVDIAGVNLMKQGNVEIGADQQAQTDLAEVAALLFVVASLRELGGSAGVDVGEEIGAVVDQGVEIELESLDEALGQLLFASEDVLGGDPIHVV